MDAISASATTIAPSARASYTGPIDPKRQAEERRAEQVRVQSDQATRDRGDRSDTGKGVGGQVDVEA